MTRTIMLWLVLMLGFIVLYHEPEAGQVVLGAIIGAAALLGSSLVVLRTSRPRSRAKVYGLLLVVAAVAAVPAGIAANALGPAALVAALGVSSGLIVTIVGVMRVRDLRARTTLDELTHALGAREDVAAQVAEIAGHRTYRYLGALELLLAHRRADLVVDLLSAPWPGLATVDYQVSALLDLGRIAEARAIFDQRLPSRAPALADALVLLRARLQIAEGSPPTALPATKYFPERRLEILADLSAARGDRGEASRLLHDLRDRYGDLRLQRLADSTRPSAAIAAEVRAGAEAPYR